MTEREKLMVRLSIERDSAMWYDATIIWQASRRAALEEAIGAIESHKVPIGNSAAGEMACNWTMDALHEIRDAIRALANGDANG